ncbi:hypothetical protein AB4Z45_08685 [Paenibacillus sp. MCAF9]|uniref:hypothetical protein n=1 Tax=Paenibacillus sp. MCAF9 TaxID=3233046 RepID=UPI003F9CF00D
MARKYHYYNVYITKDGTATRLYFSDLIDLIRLTVSWPNRLRKIKNYPTALFEIAVPQEDQLCRVATIGKYRQNVKPYLGDINTNQAQMIQNDVIEMTTIVAIPQSRLVLIEFNFYGIRAKDIQEYFNTFFNAIAPGNNWNVVFDFVSSDRSIHDIRTSTDIKEIDLRINAGSGMFASMLEQAQTVQRKNSLFGKLISISNDIKEETEAPIVNLSFGKGRKRTLELDAREIMNLVDLLDVDNNDAVESCKVTYKNPISEKYETLELKNVGVRSNTVLENDNGNHGWQFIGDKILEKYIELGRPASTVFLDKRIQFIDEEMPEINQLPAAHYRVQVVDDVRQDLEVEVDTA